MKISKLHIENFKCFENLNLDLGKLTILTGANSSGKSSVMYSILSALQSDNFPLKYSMNGEYVNMGDFEDVSYLHNKNNSICLGFTMDFDSEEVVLETTWIYDRIKKQPKFQSLSLTEKHYELRITPKETKLLVEFVFLKNNDTKELENSFQFHYKFNELLNDSFLKDLSKTQNKNAIGLERLEKKFKLNSKKIRFTIDKIEDLREAIDKKGSYVFFVEFNNLINKLRGLNSYSNYISSFRLNPSKLKYEISQSKLKVRKNGEKYEDQILEWEYKKSPEYSELIAILKKLNLLEDIKPRRVVGGNYEIKIKTHKNGVYSSLTDVGFGISQFLPIIVADIQLPKESTLFISQPEIHLHPSIQSDFGDYVSDQIKEKDKNYVIETHSEYFINKIRLLIVNKKLKKEDVCVYYFGKNKNKVEPYKLEFTENGEIKNAPDDFFTTYMTDVMNIALNG